MNRDGFIPAGSRLFCCRPENAGSVSICRKLLFNTVSNVPLWSHQYLQAWGLNFSLRKFHKLRNVCHQSSSSYAVLYHEPHAVWAKSSSCFWYAVNNNLVDMFGWSWAGVIVEECDLTLTADNPSDTLASTLWYSYRWRYNPTEKTTVNLSGELNISSFMNPMTDYFLDLSHL